MLRESRFNTQLLTIHTKKDIENFIISVFKLSDRCFSYRQKFLKSNAFQFFLQINVRSRTKSPDSEFRPPLPPLVITALSIVKVMLVFYCCCFFLPLMRNSNAGYIN